MTHSPVQIGPFTCHLIDTGRFMLDGGAMFGVVPKTLWSRQIPADDKNRIPMAMRCMLLQSEQTGKIYLIDNGSGTKFDEKMTAIYGLDYDHSNLESSLKNAGFDPADITDIVFTHLHFDHCGGTTYFDADGALQHTFPNATYHVNKRHWVTATNPNKRERASFLKENIQPIADSGRLQLVDDDVVYEPGFSVFTMEGHTIGQQLPVIDGGETKLVFAADLIPTAAHVPLPWVMGYDMRPIETLAEKEVFLNRAAEEQWNLFLEHDAFNEVIQLEKTDGKVAVKQSFAFSDLA